MSVTIYPVDPRRVKVSAGGSRLDQVRAHKLPAYHPRSRTFALRVLQLSARASRRPSQAASMHKALRGAWRVMPWCPASADQ